MAFTLLASILIPALSFPFVYLAGKKSAKAAAVVVALITLVDLALVLTTVPAVLSGPPYRYEEVYAWIPVVLNSSFTLFVDGISLSIVVMTLVIILAAVLFSINYMEEKKNLATYYALMTLLTVGLVGVFIASNLLLFYFFWELMIVPAYFILGNWGYKDSYKAAFKFFIYTHAGAVFIILGIGGIFMLTGNLDMFQVAQSLASANATYVKWILIALTGGFAVKMAIVPLHSWLPDAHSEAPAPLSALLSGVLISAGAYAIMRISLFTILPALTPNSVVFTNDFLYALSILGIISAFFGAFLAMRETDVKRIMAYSSISGMGYIMFGFSLFPNAMAINGTVLQIVAHGISKGLFFLTAGALSHQLATRDMREMGGLAGEMPTTATSSITAALSLAGTPPFACFISEALIFLGAFQVIMSASGSFYVVPTALMLIATVLSLAYSLRFISKVFFGQPKGESKTLDVPKFMKAGMIILAILPVFIGIYPTFFLNLISTVHII
jgi:NADH-quinone oxidoreductase subunit M